MTLLSLIEFLFGLLGLLQLVFILRYIQSTFKLDYNDDAYPFKQLEGHPHDVEHVEKYSNATHDGLKYIFFFV